MKLKFGRKPKVENRRTFLLGDLFNRTLDILGPPPDQTNDYTSAVERSVGPNWGVLGNDVWGDCVEATEAHALMLRTANAGQIVIPSAQDTLQLYHDETGFNWTDATDQGTDETSDCQYMMNTGFLGHQARATGPIDHTNLAYLKWAVQLFGSVQIGIAVTQAMMDQFDQGKPWDYVPGSPIEGLHSIPIIRLFSDGSGDGVSWGQRVHFTPAWINPANRILDEAHVQVFPDWVEANGAAPSGFQMTQLLIDAGLIEGNSPQTGTHSHRWHIKRRRRHARLGIS